MGIKDKKMWKSMCQVCVSNALLTHTEVRSTYSRWNNFKLNVNLLCLRLKLVSLAVQVCNMPWQENPVSISLTAVMKLVFITWKSVSKVKLYQPFSFLIQNMYILKKPYEKGKSIPGLELFLSQDAQKFLLIINLKLRKEHLPFFKFLLIYFYILPWKFSWQIFSLLKELII